MNMNDLKFGFGRTTLTLQKYSPEILLGAGLIGMVVTIVMGSKATLKVEEIVDNTKTELEVIEQNHADPDLDKYTEEEYTKDVVMTYATAGTKFAKLYAPTAGVFVASTACILASRGIMAHRHAVIVSAYNLLSEGYKNYRHRVATEFGEEKDRMFHQGYEERIETVTNEDEDGKKVKNKIRVFEQTARQIPSIYAKFFDESSIEWRTTRNLNNFFLLTQQTWCNDQLKARGHMFLNEVYDRLGIPRTLEGQMVGWVYEKDNPHGDNYISFGLYDPSNPGSRDFINGYNPAVLLDFNVDGIVHELIFRT